MPVSSKAELREARRHSPRYRMNSNTLRLTVIDAFDEWVSRSARSSSATSSPPNAGLHVGESVVSSADSVSQSSGLDSVSEFDGSMSIPGTEHLDDEEPTSSTRVARIRRMPNTTGSMRNLLTGIATQYERALDKQHTALRRSSPVRRNLPIEGEPRHATIAVAEIVSVEPVATTTDPHHASSAVPIAHHTGYMNTTEDEPVWRR